MNKGFYGKSFDHGVIADDASAAQKEKLEDRYFSGNPDGLQYENHESVDSATWVPEGYVCIRVDSRGVGRSPGLQAPFSVQQAEDYYDAIEWAGTQPWSNGNVGLWGMSYLAITQHTVASLQPPHLKAMIALGTDADLYNEAFYGGGLFGEGFWMWWRKAMAGHNFVGERHETDWLEQVLKTPFNDPEAYGHNGSVFMRPAAREGHGARVDRRPADGRRHPPGRQQRDLHPLVRRHRRRSSTSSTPGSRTATSQSTVAEHMAVLRPLAQGRRQRSHGQRRRSGCRFAPATAATSSRRSPSGPSPEPTTDAGTSTPRRPTGQATVAAPTSCGSVAVTARHRGQHDVRRPPRRRPPLQAPGRVRRWHPALVDRRDVHQRADDRGHGPGRLHEGRVSGSPRPAPTWTSSSRCASSTRTTVRSATRASCRPSTRPTSTRPGHGLLKVSHRVLDESRSTDYWPVHTHARGRPRAARGGRGRGHRGRAQPEQRPDPRGARLRIDIQPYSPAGIPSRAYDEQLPRGRHQHRPHRPRPPELHPAADRARAMTAYLQETPTMTETDNRVDERSSPRSSRRSVHSDPTLRERALEAERAGRHSDETIADLHATGAFDIAQPRRVRRLRADRAPAARRRRRGRPSGTARPDGSCGAAARRTGSRSATGAKVVEEVYGPEWVGPRVSGSSHFPALAGQAVARRRRLGPLRRPLDLRAPTRCGRRSPTSGCIADDGEGPYLVAVQVPRDELRFLDDWHVAGMRATGSVSVELEGDDLFVPDLPRRRLPRDRRPARTTAGSAGRCGTSPPSAGRSARWPGCRSAWPRARWSGSSSDPPAGRSAARRTRTSSTRP